MLYGKSKTLKNKWLDDKDCTGCGACAAVCPVRAITMREHSDGFDYPVFKSSCIDCNLCEEVCSRRVARASGADYQRKVFACWSLSEKTRFESTSGGAFTELARSVLASGGLVCGAVYRDTHHVEHRLVGTEKELSAVRQSKYVQSHVSDSFEAVKRSLEGGSEVLFCGTPCQVAGLKAFLNKKYERLITIDFICRGVNSPKAYRAWLDELEGRRGSKAVRVWFKYKVGGWKTSPRRTFVSYENGTVEVLDAGENLFMEAYLGPNLFIRPSCGNCLFKGRERLSDITLGDFWGIDQRLDDDKGVSMLLVNTQRGAELFERSRRSLISYERDLNEVLLGNRCFDSSIDVSSFSGLALRRLDDSPFSKVVAPFIRKPFLVRLRRALKEVIHVGK